MLKMKVGPILEQQPSANYGGADKLMNVYYTQQAGADQSKGSKDKSTLFESFLSLYK
jgi:hypothetical protein